LILKKIRNGELNIQKSFKIYHFHDTSFNSKMKIPCNISDNKMLREDGSNLASFLYYLKNNCEQEFKIIEAVIKSIAPFFEKFDLEPDKNNKNQIQLEWKEINSDMYLNAHNFSDGTLRFIALTTLLLQPQPPKIIIIDEPELGLHPFALNKLASMIKVASNKSQIIVSTQSVNLINNFDAENIIVVDRKDNQSVFCRLKQNELKTWLEDYSVGDLWEKNVIGGQP
jgi:predicted ATPase